MLSLLQYNRAAWSDYFPGNTPNAVQAEYTERQTPTASSGGGVYVLNCLFRSITSASDGGALFCNTSVTYLLIESSSFFSCKTSGTVGAIYFSNTGSGQSVLHKVCGNDCCTTNSNSNQFAKMQVNNTASSKNYVKYSSIVRCVNANSNPWYIIELYNGNICCPSVNVSMNKCYGHSGITPRPFKDESSVTCLLSYSSFTDNSATGRICFYFDIAGAKCEIKNCNILRNTQAEFNSCGPIYSTGNLMIIYSCILENKANCIFYQSSSSYSITLSNCTVDSTSNNQNLVVQSTVTKSFILALNHMSTRNCHSEFDVVGTLTHIIPYVPQPTKKIICFTANNFHYQARISDLFSLTYLFMVTFIHPNPSGDC
jgi:hypothetical protein